MSKKGTITDSINQILNLQKENEALKASIKTVNKIANQYTKTEFGYSVNELHEIVKSYESYKRRAKERDAAKQGQQQL